MCVAKDDAAGRFRVPAGIIYIVYSIYDQDTSWYSGVSTTGTHSLIPLCPLSASNSPNASGCALNHTNKGYYNKSYRRPYIVKCICCCEMTQLAEGGAQHD